MIKSGNRIWKPESTFFLLLISFFEGGAVMAVELIGAKMIEPFFGASLYVWSTVLAITLLGLTSGYYSGGIISEKFPKPKTLYLLLFLASLFTGMMPLIGTTVMEATLNFDFRTGAIISCLIFVFPPLVCFGMVSPVIIRKLSTQLEQTGRKAGLVYAISTIGGILFTFLTGFYLIPEIGLRMSSVLVSVILLIFPIIYFVRDKKIFIFMTVVLWAFICPAINYKIISKPIPMNKYFRQVYQSDGLLGHLSVIDYLQTNTRCLFVNNVSQSYMHNPSGRSQWRYVHRLATYTSFKPAGSNVFLAGLGAGNVVNELNILGFETDVCEIEKRMKLIGENYFGLTKNVNVIIDDARHAIKTAKKKYDIVILDISAGENQPNNLYTIEGFNDIKKMMKPDAALFVHYPTVLNAPDGLALKSIWKTMEKSGYNVEFINTSPDFNGVWEYIFFATLDGSSLADRNFDRRDHFADPFNFPLKKNLLLGNIDYSQGIVMTDDKPVMEILHRHMALRHRQAGIDVTIKGLVGQKIRMF